jgi:hypothetical protein
MVVAAPAPTIEVLLPLMSTSPIRLLPLKPSPAPEVVRLYVPGGTLMVVPGFRFANVTAPRRLQSFAAAVHAEAVTASSVRSTETAANIGLIIVALFALALAPLGLIRTLVFSRGVGAAELEFRLGKNATLNSASTNANAINRRTLMR